MNGAELRAELNAAGVTISNDPSAVQLDGETLRLDIADGDKTKAAQIVAAHNGTMIAPPPTPEQKLFAATGLTVAEYKALLS